MKRVLILAFILAQGFWLMAQTPKRVIDSLIQVIETSKVDTTLIITYIELSEETNNLDSILLLTEQCFKIIDRATPGANDIKLKTLKMAKASCFNNIGYVAGLKGDSQKQVEYYLKAAKLHKETNFKVGLATSYNNLAYAFENQGQVENSLLYNFKALKIMEEIGNQRGIARSLNNIGSVYDSQNDAEKAMEYYKKSLEIRRKINDLRGIGISLINIGSVYRDKGLIDTAIQYYHWSISQFKKVNDELSLASAYNNLGNIYLKSMTHDSAVFYFNQSLVLRKKYNNKDGISYSYNNLGSLYWARKNYILAEQYALESFKIAKEIGYPKNIYNAAKLLSDIYKAKNNHKKALDYTELMYQMKDSLKNENTRKSIIRNQFKYEFEKKALADSLKSLQQKAIFQSKLEKEQTQKKYLYIIIAMVFISGIFIFNRYQVSIKQKKIIENQKAIVDHKQKELLDSINYSKTIQNVFLPKFKLVKSYLENSFILYLPKDIVAGDFYWMEVFKENTADSQTNEANNIIYIAVCDCTGHGVPGAMVSVVCNNALNRAVKEYGNKVPGKIFDKAKELIIENFSSNEEELKDGMDAGLVAINLDERKIQWSGANSPLWIVSKTKPITNSEIHNRDGVWEIKSDKQAIGKGYDSVPFTTHFVQLTDGDTIYMTTDGYADQFGGEKRKKLSKKKLREFLVSISGYSMEEQQKALHNYHIEYKNDEEQVDDICVVGIRV
jgi:serine phosphatase RsbU (regulator of sigma subunit)